MSIMQLVKKKKGGKRPGYRDRVVIKEELQIKVAPVIQVLVHQQEEKGKVTILDQKIMELQNKI